jgi:hypothetical protein
VIKTTPTADSCKGLISNKYESPPIIVIISKAKTIIRRPDVIFSKPSENELKLAVKPRKPGNK